MQRFLDVLKQRFGYDTYRAGQEPVISALMENRDVLAVMPTGGGKSLCYQLPAIAAGRLTLVISPLISLMKDQVDGLQAMGVRAERLDSALSAGEVAHILNQAMEGKLELLYLAPERLENDAFLQRLLALPVHYIAVDEAHCISHWGHDFRPSYRRIPGLLRGFPKRPVYAAFTATATNRVRDDIVNLLALRDPFIYVGSFDRPNLYFRVEKPRDKRRRLLQLVEPEESVIIYCATRKTVETVHAYLTDHRVKASCYHAGMPARARTHNQEAFIFDETQVMVATNAFGMGIDKPDVRHVIHYNMPKDLESYYQEAGRAGRDGAPAKATLLFSAQDIIMASLLIEQGDNPSAKANLSHMVAYCHTGYCLRRTLLNYFDEEPDWQRCGYCSLCDGEVEVSDITKECRMILSCVARMNQRFGVGLVVAVLRGKENPRIKSYQFNRLTTYGLLKAYSDSDVRDMISLLLVDGYMRQEGNPYPVLKLTKKSRNLLLGEDVMHIHKQLKVPDVKKEKKRAITGYDKGLFQALRGLRKELADNIGKPPFVVFSDRSLMEMAARFPTSPEAFLDIIGVGETKLENYGTPFMTLIKGYIKEQGIDVEEARGKHLTI